MTAAAWTSPVPDGSFGRPKNCSTPTPETRTGSLEDAHLFLLSDHPLAFHPSEPSMGLLHQTLTSSGLMHISETLFLSDELSFC